MERVPPTAGRAAPAEGGAPAQPAIRVRPTQQGTVYLWTIGVFSATLLCLGENLVFLLGAFALGCGTVAWFLARRNLQGLACRRELPRHTTAGAPTPLTWRVAGAPRRTAVGVEVHDRPARGSRPMRLEVEFPVVPRGETVAASAAVVFARRGVLDLGLSRCEASSRYPLGLFRATLEIPLDGRLVVRPREGRPTNRLRAFLRGRRPEEMRRRRVWSGDDVIYGIREFREGDDPRRVHWRTTARRGVLTVSEWRAEQGREAVLVLGRGVGAGVASSATFERAVSATATMWRLCAHERLRTRLVLGGRGERRLEGSGRGLEDGLAALTRVAAQGSRDPRRALRGLGEQGGPRTVVYVASGREPGLEADLAAAAGRGGSWVVIPAHHRSLGRWVRGLGR